jgi:hypothetical protein
MSQLVGAMMPASAFYARFASALLQFQHGWLCVGAVAEGADRHSGSAGLDRLSFSCKAPGTRVSFMSVLIRLLAAAALLAPLTSMAQTPAGSRAAGTDGQLRASFNGGFSKGCLSGRTPEVANQTGYCNCMVAAYNSRYNGATLAAIVNAASQAPKVGPVLVDLMMGPERQACVARY